MANRVPEVIALRFVKKYYTTLEKKDFTKILEFYGEDAIITRGDESNGQRGKITGSGHKGISSVLQSFHYPVSSIRLRTLDVQPAIDGCLIVVVLGTDGEEHRFSQTFLLTMAGSDPGGEDPGTYYIQNDLLRYHAEEVPYEEDGEWADDQETPHPPHGPSPHVPPAAHRSPPYAPPAHGPPAHGLPPPRQQPGPPKTGATTGGTRPPPFSEPSRPAGPVSPGRAPVRTAPPAQRSSYGDGDYYDRDNCSLFLRNLPYDLDEPRLRAALSTCFQGLPIKSLTLKQGFGFVDFANPEITQQALDNAYSGNAIYLDGREIRIEQRNSPSGRGGRSGGAGSTQGRRGGRGGRTDTRNRF